MNFPAAFHWMHGVIVVVAAIGYAWLWYRRGFWLPGYVHIIAFVALIAGILVTASLPPPANPNPIVQFLFPFIFPVLFVAATYGIAVLLGYAELAAKLRTHVRILDVPPGDAPRAVREAWVGLLLPIADGEVTPRELQTSGEPAPEGRFYLVYFDRALDVLEAASPENAAWWRENKPEMIGRGIKVGFAAEVCEKVIV
jgi:hypothetical protein